MLHFLKLWDCSGSYISNLLDWYQSTPNLSKVAACLGWDSLLLGVGWKCRCGARLQQKSLLVSNPKPGSCLRDLFPCQHSTSPFLLHPPSQITYYKPFTSQLKLKNPDCQLAMYRIAFFSTYLLNAHNLFGLIYDAMLSPPQQLCPPLHSRFQYISHIIYNIIKLCLTA